MSFLVLQSTAALAEEMTVTAVYSKRAVQVNEEIRLTIRVVGASGNVQAPRLPTFPEFDSFYTGRASHMTFVNGRSSSSLEFSYVLVPREAGRFTLSPIQMTIQGRSFQTDPVEIEVTAASGSTSPGQASMPNPVSAPPPAGSVQAPEPAFKPTDDNIFMRAWVDKATVYPNEQVLLTYSLYTRYDTRYEGFEKEPAVSGFWIEDFPPEKDIKRETVRLNGKRYVKADVKKVALFPQAAADYTIDPGTIKVSIRQEPHSNSVFDEFFNDSFFSGGSFFSRRENRILKPLPIALTVKPFPEAGKPKSFTGAVGNFRLNATVDKTSVPQNEPVTMKLVIEGEGNIETLNKPTLPELDQYKIYDADTSSELYRTGSVIGGKKTFEIVFIPITAGPQKLPQLKFSFYNPRSGSYQELTTPEFNLSVTPSETQFELPKTLSQQSVFKKDIEREGRDIHFIQEAAVRKEGQLLSLLIKVLIVLNILLTLLAIYGFFSERRDNSLEGNIALKRKKLARSHAENYIKRLKKLARSKKDEDEAAYFDGVGRTLTQYISDKFNLSSQGATQMEIDSMLATKLGTEDPLYKKIMDLYKVCDEARFARAALPKDAKATSMKTLQETISRMEKLK